MIKNSGQRTVTSLIILAMSSSTVIVEHSRNTGNIIRWNLSFYVPPPFSVLQLIKNQTFCALQCSAAFWDINAYAFFSFLVAFLVPYLLMLAVAGLPIIYLELSFGQFGGRSLISIWSICPPLKGTFLASSYKRFNLHEHPLFDTRSNCKSILIEFEYMVKWT